MSEFARVRELAADIREPIPGYRWYVVRGGAEDAQYLFPAGTWSGCCYHPRVAVHGYYATREEAEAKLKEVTG